MIWLILYVVAGITLLLHMTSRNAVWGAATLGLLVGTVIAIFSEGFDWLLIAKSVTIATLVGTCIEWLPRLGNQKQQP